MGKNTHTHILHEGERIERVNREYHTRRSGAYIITDKLGQYLIMSQKLNLLCKGNAFDDSHLHYLLCLARTRIIQRLEYQDFDNTQHFTLSAYSVQNFNEGTFKLFVV